MKLIISNRGTIEPGALSLMGASVKDGDAIGKFGSGFKYALATLFRHGVEIRIFSGEREITVETRKETFRDHEFDVLWIDGVRTSITTATGREWKIRDAVREIWSNAYDEGQAVHYAAEDVRPLPGHTLISIEAVPEVRKMIENWDNYFVNDLPALHSNMSGRIIEQSLTNFYRRGVWICEDRERIGLFSYDFAEFDLPESRKVNSHSALYPVYEVLGRCAEPKVWEKLFSNLNADLAEWTAINHWGVLSPRVRDVIREVFNRRWDYIGNEKLRDKLQVGDKRVLWVDGFFVHCIAKLGIENIADKLDHLEDFVIIPWPIGYEERLGESLATLRKVGIEYERFPIVFCRAENDNQTIARAHRGKCYLTARAFEVDKNMLLKALVEEWTHLEHNVLDCTIAQQHVYLDLIVSLINRSK